MKARLTVLRDVGGGRGKDGTAEVLTFPELRALVLSGRVLRHVLRYREVVGRTYLLASMSKPFNTALLLRLLSRGSCRIEDESGRVLKIGPGTLLSLLGRLVRDGAGKGTLLRKAAGEVAGLAAGRPRGGSAAFRPDWEGTPVYLRTDLVFGLRSGGSVGHIAGVLNSLGEHSAPPLFVSTDVIPTVRPGIETWIHRPDGAFADYAELPGIHFNGPLAEAVGERLAGRRPAFFYQRYSLNSYAGVRLAERFRVPFVLEYNGSEVWISRHWGSPLKYEAFSLSVEELNLAAASLVVVVSRAMAGELEGRGVDRQKILVNPNGVDTDSYRPDVNGRAVRTACRLEGTTVIGFIGTFGKWHGAEVLAEAFRLLLAENPAHQRSLRLLLIGDGVMMPEVRERLGGLEQSGAAILTGIVPQERGPEYLAACDILVAPHVPNPDGTPFFGSPTKLFEYMAMGRGIVASGLDQIGEVLAHGETAWLVEPGNVTALARGLRTLAEDGELRARLGAAARRRAVSRHTWREHTRRIVEGLRERCR